MNHLCRMAALAALLGAGAARAAAPHAALVDPFIGTSGGGNVFPGAAAPFGMVQFSPDTRAPSIGYSYDDKQIQGFSLTHMSGVGCDDYGDVFLTATTGPLKTAAPDYYSTFDHGHESASPGAYQVTLDPSGVSVELTATEHAGMARFQFPAGKDANILAPISHTLTRSYASDVRVVNEHELAGSVTSQAFCGARQRYTVYFVMRLDTPFAESGTWKDAEVGAGARAVEQTDEKTTIGAYVRWPAGAARTVTARIGISYVDEDGARRNLAREVGDLGFDTVRNATAAAWEKELSCLDVDGGTEVQRKAFYTALYHCFLMPSVFSDVDGRYRGFDGRIHTMPKGRQLYANFSGWDIYRNEVSLLALLQPRRAEDMCESIARMVHEGGWIDRWPQANVYTNVMVGSPLTSMVATVWNAGLHDFDMPTLYEGMWNDATVEPPPGKPYHGERGVEWIDKIGYIPYDKTDHSVSKTEEDCYAYSALATIADSLGRADDAEYMRRRSRSYRPLWDASTGFMRPRSSTGEWLSPLDPLKDDWGQYTEGTAWQYIWLVSHDVQGLINLMGGDDAFNKRLAEFFTAGYYNAYNEPDLQAPFLFDYSGAPWKTQDTVRGLLAKVYSDQPNGIPGNDDCGAMSSWYLFASMGFYPQDPARPEFVLCSPVFPKVTIHLPERWKSRTFIITAPDASEAGRYIASATLNGKAWEKPWIRLADITEGTGLTVALGAEPGTEWGTAAANRPPSITPRREGPRDNAPRTVLQ